MTRSAILANRTLFNTRLEMWNTELKYINARIEEWKGSGQAPNKQHPELRAYLLRALRDNIVFEAKVRLLSTHDFKDVFHRLSRCSRTLGTPLRRFATEPLIVARSTSCWTACRPARPSGSTTWQSGNSTKKRRMLSRTTR